MAIPGVGTCTSLEKVFVEDDIRHSWVLKIRIFTKLWSSADLFWYMSLSEKSASQNPLVYHIFCFFPLNWLYWRYIPLSNRPICLNDFLQNGIYAPWLLGEIRGFYLFVVWYDMCGLCYLRVGLIFFVFWETFCNFFFVVYLVYMLGLELMKILIIL